MWPCPFPTSITITPRVWIYGFDKNQSIISLAVFPTHQYLSLFNGISTLFMLFNAKTILLEEQ